MFRLSVTCFESFDLHYGYPVSCKHLTVSFIAVCALFLYRSLLNENFLPLGKWFARPDSSVATDGRYMRSYGAIITTGKWDILAFRRLLPAKGPWPSRYLYTVRDPGHPDTSIL